MIFFNEKKIEKDSDDFWYRKLTLKVKRLGDFALFDTSPLTQFSKFNNFLWVYWFFGKNLSNFVPPRLKTPQPVLPYCSWCLFTLTFFGKVYFSNMYSSLHGLLLANLQYLSREFLNVSWLQYIPDIFFWLFLIDF